MEIVVLYNISADMLPWNTVEYIQTEAQSGQCGSPTHLLTFSMSDGDPVYGWSVSLSETDEETADYDSGREILIGGSIQLLRWLQFIDIFVSQA